MLYTIENSEIRVQISDMGAELQSICLKADGSEYLWQGDKTFWSGRAYNLFPICGRLSEGKYTYAGKTYEMNLHGFARKTAFEAVDQGPDSISFPCAIPVPVRFDPSLSVGGYRRPDDIYRKELG